MRERFTEIILVGGAALVIVAALVTLSIGRGQSVAPEAEIRATPTEGQPAAGLREVNFDYEVVSVSETEVVLKGAAGDVRLPNSPSVQIVKREGARDTVVGFAALTPGEKARVETIPGKTARVYLVED